MYYLQKTERKIRLQTRTEKTLNETDKQLWYEQAEMPALLIYTERERLTWKTITQTILLSARETFHLVVLNGIHFLIKYSILI